MRNYNKKTLVLILASAITVISSFAADNYKNTLMQIDFASRQNSIITTVFSTKSDYTGEINMTEISPNTYVAVLPETDSQANAPVINDNIQSVDIKTIPYTNESKGYTKITIKTNAGIRLNAATQLFIAQNQTPLLETSSKTDESMTQNQYETEEAEQKPDSAESEVRKGSNNADVNNEQKELRTDKTFSAIASKGKRLTKSNKTSNAEFNPTQFFPYAFGGVIILFLLLLMYRQGKKKMDDLVGTSDYDFDDNQQKNNKQNNNTDYQTKRKRAASVSREQINLPASDVNMITGQINSSSVDDEKQDESPAPISVDLDELYGKSKENNIQSETVTVSAEVEIGEEAKPDEEIDDLASFLDDFTFEEEINAREATDEAEEELYNEELYNEVLSYNDIVFSKSDITRIKQLLKQELSEDVMNEVKRYVSNPVVPPKTKEQVLEDFVIDYRVKQNITFSHEDIEILRKLLSVEIDSSFVTDLRTDIKKQPVKKDKIKIFDELKKPAPVKVLKVGDMLPDLAAEMKKMEGKKILSEAKPEVIYFSEGYDVDILPTDNLLANINFNNVEERKYRPSDKINTVAKGFDIKLLEVADMLADTDKEYSKNNVSADDEQKIETKNHQKISENQKNVKKQLQSNISDGKNGIQKKPNISNTGNLQRETANNKQQKSVKPPVKQTVLAEEKLQKNDKCIINDQVYTILSEYEISENQGVYLLQNDEEYCVMGFKDKNFFELKKYTDIKNTNIQGRLSEKLDNGIMQYIIRLGAKKFIINVSQKNMEYVMELC